MSPNQRKTLGFGTSVVALVLALASVASACIVWKGKLTVDPAPTGRTNGNTVIGKETQQHAYCAGGEPTTAATAKNGESITYTVAATASGDPCYSTTNKLSANTTYEVRILNESGNGTRYTGWPYTRSSSTSTWVWTSGSGCYNGGTWGDLQGTFTTNASSGGSLTANLNLASNNINGTNDASEVCVGRSVNPGSNAGIFAPLQVVSV